MIINRSNITSILGVPFSKNFSLTEMKDAITAALPNVKDTYPKLYQYLQQQLIAIDALIIQEQQIESKATSVSNLQILIEKTKRAYYKAVREYEEKNQLIITAMGTAPTGGPPLYPTVGVETSPLIVAVKQTHTALVQLQSQLDQSNEELNQAADSHNQQVEKIGNDIQKQIESADSIKYDTQKEQYIYT